MSAFPPTLILRHRKENLKKCTLRGLEERADCRFFTYPQEKLPCLEGYILLTLEAPVLSQSDAHLGLLLIDGTWRYAATMQKQLPPIFHKRSLPAHFKTAYPRAQTDCIDPLRGLASIEALYAAYNTLGRCTAGLLDNFYWREKFLAGLTF